MIRGNTPCQGDVESARADRTCGDCAYCQGGYDEPSRCYHRKAKGRYHNGVDSGGAVPCKRFKVYQCWFNQKTAAMIVTEWREDSCDDWY